MNTIDQRKEKNNNNKNENGNSRKIQIPLLLMLQKTMVMARLWLLDIGQVYGKDHIKMVDGVLMD